MSACAPPHRMIIREVLKAEPVPRTERSPRRWWLGHMATMSHKRLAKQDLLATPKGQRPRVRPRTGWRDWISGLTWLPFDVELEELSELDENLEEFRDLGLLPPQPPEKNLKIENTVWKIENEFTGKECQTHSWRGYFPTLAVCNSKFFFKKRGALGTKGVKVKIIMRHRIEKFHLKCKTWGNIFRWHEKLWLHHVALAYGIHCKYSSLRLKTATALWT